VPHICPCPEGQVCCLFLSLHAQSLLSHWMLWDFPSQIRKVLFAKSISFKNVQKKNGLRCQNLFVLQNKESTWCASIFRSKYPRNGYIYIPVCRMFQICANHAKSVPYFLVLKGEIRENWPLSLCKVYCSCASFHYWPPGPQKICSSIYYNTTVDWNLYKKWPNLGTTPL